MSRMLELLEEDERAAATVYLAEHAGVCCAGSTTIGGRWTWSFTPTGLGTHVVLRCNACRARRDLTSYTGWL